MNFNHWSDATRGVGDALIIKRRQRENNVAKLVHAISDSNNQCHRANWEQNVQSKDRAAKIHQTYSKLKNQQESQLHARRIRLTLLIDILQVTGLTNEMRLSDLLSYTIANWRNGQKLVLLALRPRKIESKSSSDS